MSDRTATRSEERTRRTERVLLRIPIEVKGKAADGKAFSEKTFTLLLNKDGARIGLKAAVRPKDELTITNLQTKESCPFRVVERTSDKLGDGAPEWGVECLEPEVNFWRINFPRKSAGPVQPELVDALLECSKCQSRELAQLALEQYRTLAGQSAITRVCAKCGGETQWGFGFVEAEPDEAFPTQPAQSPEPSVEEPGAERRRAKRVTVKLPVLIRLADGREEVARTENLSKTGVCFGSDLKMQKGDVVRLTVGHSPGGNEAEVTGRIVWRRPAEGTQRLLYGVHLDEPQ
jgi:hypothetical protein